MTNKTQRQFWLVKFAPFRTSWTDIVRVGSFTLRGVRNPQARNNLAQMSIGDFAFFYHSQKELAIVGILRVTRASYPDPTSVDPRWLTCDFAPEQTLSSPLQLVQLKSESALVTLSLIRQPRLAVHRVLPFEWEIILHLANETTPPTPEPAK